MELRYVHAYKWRIANEIGFQKRRIQHEKNVALILALMELITFLGSAYADVDSEVLFREVPWGSSATQFQFLMKKQKVSGNINEESYNYMWKFQPDDREIKSISHLEDCGCKFYSYPKNLKVAGFDVEKVEASFLFRMTRMLCIQKKRNRHSIRQNMYLM